jgi:hypothetical protein
VLSLFRLIDVGARWAGGQPAPFYFTETNNPCCDWPAFDFSFFLTRMI